MASFGNMAAILNIGIRADTNTASRQLRQLDSSLKRTETTARGTVRQTDRLHDSTRRMGPTLMGAAKAAIALGASYVGLQAAKQAVTATTDLAKSTMTLKKGFGLTIGTASELGAVLKSRGADVSSVGMAFNTLSKQVVAAKRGTETSVAAFEKVGVSLKDIKSMSPDQLLFEISNGMQAAGKGADRMAASSTLFGRGWKTIVPVLREGAGYLQEQLDLANKYGASFGGKSIKSIKDLIATERELKIAQLGLQVQFTERIAPALIKFGLAIADAIHFVENMSPALRNFIGALGLVATAIYVAVKAQAAFNVMVAMNPWVLLAAAAVAAAILIIKNWGKVSEFFTKFIDRLNRGWANLGDRLAAPFVDAYFAIRPWIQKIADVLNVIPGVDIHLPGRGAGGVGPKGGPTAKANKGKGPMGPVGQFVPPGISGPTKQLGGFAGIVPGQGSGDKVGVQALVEPGEGLFVMNRNAMSGLMAMNNAMPRFALGGIPKAIGKFGAAAGGLLPSLPGTGELPGWLQGMGHYVLAKAGAFIKSRVAGMFSATGKTPSNLGEIHKQFPQLQPGISNILASVMQNTTGLTVSSTTGGNHVPGSLHPLGRAVDLSGPGTAMYRAAQWIAEHLTPRLGQGIHNPNLSVDAGRTVPSSFWGSQWANHLDHIHLSKQRGGMVSGNWNKNQLTTLAAYVGMKNPGLMAAIAMAESAGNPNARGSSGEYGLWQIMPSWGGGSSLLNPLKNARKAKHILGVQGLGAWTTYTSGAYKNFLGGKVKPGLMSRLRGVKTGTTGKTAAGMKAPPALGAAMGFAGGDVDAMNTRIGAINDLRAARNLLALQGYQVGAAQNPILGLASPAYPSLAPMLPGAMESTSMDASNVSAGPRAKWGFHTHVYIDGKEVRHVTKKQLKRTARGGRRRLPSAGGG